MISQQDKSFIIRDSEYKVVGRKLEKILVNINVGRWDIFSPQTWKEIILPEKNIEVSKENNSNWKDPDNGKIAVPVTKATIKAEAKRGGTTFV